ncbi:hypothetical protein AGMMS50268_09220 [Spirochaetia bacterium]|nr:hypothetical protein AGMMS50268_09220 [Spirochaetia bacterium]
MEKKRNPNFIYIYSEALKQEIAMSKKTGDVTCADGVKYSKAEVQIVASGEVEVTLAEHRVKKIFGGEIVRYERTGSNNPGKQTPLASGDGFGNTENSGAEMAGPSKVGEVNASGELDIF